MVNASRPTNADMSGVSAYIGQTDVCQRVGSMVPEAVRLLIIHKQLGFSLRIKQTLEQLGGFEVSPFTTLENAIEYLEGWTHHVALVDFTLPGTTGPEVVQRLRAIQPEIGIIASPDEPNVNTYANQQRLDAVVDTPCKARELLPILRQVMKDHADLLPETDETPALDEEIETAQIHTAEDRDEGGVLLRTRGMKTPAADDEPGETERHARTIEFVLRANKEVPRQGNDQLPEGLNEQSVQAFQKLAAEEPPMPSSLDTGTVHELHSRIEQTDADAIAEAMKNRHQDAVPLLPAGSDAGDKAGDDMPVQLALRAAYDDSLSLGELQGTLEQSFPQVEGIQPLPSWLNWLQRYVREPDFLDTVPDDLPEMDLPDASVQATDMNNVSDVEQDPGSLETDPMPVDQRVDSRPATLPEMPPDEVEDTTSEEEPEEPTDVQAAQAADSEPEAATQDYPPVSLGTESADPHVAQLALTLTQVALQVTAEATLLVRDGELVAYAGTLPLEEVENMGEALEDDWEADPDEARIRFVTLSSSGQDFMVYSRRTEDDFTLSMIFPGRMALSAMRTQSERLLRALDSVQEEPSVAGELLDEHQTQDLQQLEAQAAQEVEAALESAAQLAAEHGDAYSLNLDDVLDIPEIPALVTYSGPLTGYTFLWITRSQDMPLSDRAIDVLNRELERQLADLGWQVKNLQVYPEYIYLRADVPVEAPPHEIIADLQQRSAWIANAADKSIDPETIWAESYCVLTPGREMDADEIAAYINFARS